LTLPQAPSASWLTGLVFLGGDPTLG
jgi:hypothetical protein